MPSSGARDPFVRAVERAILADGLLRPDESLVIGVSGGPDSVALTLTLADLAPRHGWSLTLGHLDHQLRAESAADARYVRGVGRRLGLAVHAGSRDVGVLARDEGLSIEDAARRARYAFLAGVAREVGATAIVTGHQREDQAETILLHLIQGAGPDGLRGMAPRGPLPMAPDLALVRPLLTLSRSEVEDFCRRQGLRPRRDPSNESDRFTRNRIRREILPALAAINPDAVGAIARLGRVVRADTDWIDRQAADRWDAIAAEEAGGIRFAVAALAAEPDPIRVRLIRRAAARIGSTLNARQIEAIERCLARAGEAKVAIGPAAWFWRADPWCGVGTPPAPAPVLAPARLPCPGRTAWGDWVLSADLLPSGEVPDDDPGSGRWAALIEGLTLPPRLMVRGRRAGDRLHLARPFGSKSLQDYFVDRKVPRRDREAIPIVVAEDHLVWIVGHRVDRCFQPAGSPRRPVLLRARRKDAV